tara:strand:+ start:431 stop:583 length:153 start_codon:yes stop_codon:yes gene_type:complete
MLWQAYAFYQVNFNIKLIKNRSLAYLIVRMGEKKGLLELLSALHSFTPDN